MAHICYGVTEDCININSFGEICVKCNCCGRFGEEGKKEAQIKYWGEMLLDVENFDNWCDEEQWRVIQEENRQKNIAYYKAKLAELMEVE